MTDDTSDDSDDTSDDSGDPDARTRATVRTAHASPGVVAGAVRPDNTPEIVTRVVDGRVETTVERETAGGLRATVEDYVVNLTVADRIARQATEHSETTKRHDGRTSNHE